jgi:hypothetical protein
MFKIMMCSFVVAVFLAIVASIWSVTLALYIMAWPAGFGASMAYEFLKGNIDVKSFDKKSRSW